MKFIIKLKLKSTTMETFRFPKAVFRSSVFKNRLVYTPGTPCMKGASLQIKDIADKRAL